MFKQTFSNQQLLLFAISIVILFIIIFILRIMRTKAKAEKELYESIMDCCKRSNNVNLAINSIFKILSSKIKANEYAFYLTDSKNTQYSLKSIHYKNDTNDKLNISYSGLIPHKKIKYVFPVAINISDIQNDFGQINDEKSNIIFVRVKGGKALIQLVVAPKFKLTKKISKILKNISEKLETAVFNIVSTEELNNKIKILETSKQATRSITSIISGEGILKMAISMFTKTISAKGGFFLKLQDDALELEVDTGFSKECLVMFKYDTNLHNFFNSFIGNKKIATLNVNDNNFSDIPIYLVAEGIKQILLFKISYADNFGIAGFWYDKAYEIDDYQTYSLLLMFSKISEVFGNMKQLYCNVGNNVEALKLISTLVDDLSPYTVGFSKLMEYYATIIAKEMNLPSEEIAEISLAAFLSNIGIAALSYDIFLKNGKYSEADYEIIKLHSEVGADIIESLYGNIKTANMVRYHHERIDGCGYPEGLKGNDIPIGAKILAVTQFFVAKISPRSFREASTFDEALLALKSVSNTQLDSEIVNIFINYINKIRQDNIDNDGSLDHCWNMRFVSNELCSKCNVKIKDDKKCWESKSNLCLAHGNKCETCFIYTEYVGRKK